MIDYPEYVKVDNKKYKINTDFRNAIKCQEIATDNSIDDTERALGIIYVLFGDEGLDSKEDHLKLLEMAKKYLSCGKEIDIKQVEEPDMDYIEDYDYIRTSFRSDYNINLDKEEMHWWEFYNLLNGLSNSELGDCCILNRVRNLRTYDTKCIKDKKLIEKINKAKEAVALKKNKKQATREQMESANKLFKELGL